MARPAALQPRRPPATVPTCTNKKSRRNESRVPPPPPPAAAARPHDPGCACSPRACTPRAPVPLAARAAAVNVPLRTRICVFARFSFFSNQHCSKIIELWTGTLCKERLRGASGARRFYGCCGACGAPAGHVRPLRPARAAVDSAARAPQRFRQFCILVLLTTQAQSGHARNAEISIAGWRRPRGRSGQIPVRRGPCARAATVCRPAIIRAPAVRALLAPASRAASLRLVGLVSG